MKTSDSSKLPSKYIPHQKLSQHSKDYAAKLSDILKSQFKEKQLYQAYTIIEPLF